MDRNTLERWILAITLALLLHGSAGAQSSRFRSNGDGTVTDLSLELTWQQSTPSKMTWSAANSYCMNNTPGLPGSGWRLPTILELMALLDDGRAACPLNDSALITPCATGSAVYWSSTAHPMEAGNYRTVNFYSGTVSDASGTVSRYLRCVR